MFIDDCKEPEPVFCHFYENLIEYGPYSENIVRTYAKKLIDLIEFMHEKGIKNGFYPEDLYIEKMTYQLRIDNYGDRLFFKAKDSQEGLNDNWSFGNVIFTFFNRYPPYSQPTTTDKFYLLLKNKNYAKFWEKSKRKNNTPNSVVSLLNRSFNDENSWKSIVDDQWFT